MAAGTSPRDIEAIYNAVRLRLSQAGSPSANPGGGVGPPGPPGPPGPKGVVWKGAWAVAQPYEVGDIVTNPSPDGCGGQLLTYFCLFAEESTPANEPVPGGSLNWWEMTNGALIIDGTRAMQCALDMNEFEIDNVEAVDFNPTPAAHTHAEGGAHWDASFRLPTLDIASDSGVHQIPVPSVYVRVVNQSGLTIFGGRCVRFDGTNDGTLMLASYANNNVGSNADDVAGVSLHDIGNGEAGWVCTRGHMRVVGGFAGLGGVYFLGSSGFGDLIPEIDPSQKGCYTTVRVGYAPGNDDHFIVDIERRPLVRKLSDVADADAACGDVLVREIEQGSGCERYVPSGLWTEVVFDFGPTDAPSDMKVFTVVDDPRVKSDSIITMAPSAKPVDPRQEDEAEFDVFACSCVVVQGVPSSEFRAYVHSLRGKVVGQYRFQYTVSNPASWNCYYNPV